MADSGDESGGSSVDATAPLGATLGPGASRPACERSSANFADGELLGGRYRVVRLCGEGGMGEVYEAEDLLLRERVALKTIRPSVACDEKVVQRFKREIQLARRVTHPNVCRIFDVGLHRPTNARTDSVFLTMELLEGETLAARLQRSGRLPLDEAARIVAQVGGALDAAHQAGVIHRDFKSENVVLVRTRAVVTDFGLARGPAAADSTVTGDGGVVGSPSYMAPEQVEGKELTGAADIYALGVVMYEMVTGRLPFVGDSPLSTAVLRLREDPLTPAAHVAQLPAAWEQVILRCLRRDPAERPASARAVIEEIGGGPARRPRRRIVAGIVAAAAVMSIACAFVLLNPGAAPPKAASAPEAGRRCVAVLPFKNLTGRAESGWIAGALADMVATELAASTDIRTVAAESVARARRELALGDEIGLAPDTLARLRGLLGVDFVLTGSYMALGKDSGGRIRLDMKLLDDASGETVAAFSQSGTEADLVELVTGTGRSLRSRLALGELLTSERESVRASLPRADVARLYAEGLAQLRVAACSAARGPLEQAVAADPTYPLARSALAEALACLGLEERALAEARRAVELAAPLPEQIRLTTQGRLYLIGKQPEKAIEVYEKLFARFPDNFDFGIQLAMLQLRFLRDGDLGATLAALRRLPPPAGNSPRIDVIAAYADLMAGRLDQAVARAEDARGRAEKQGARLIAADALVLESRAHALQEHADQALAAIDQARAIYEAAGDLDGIAAALSLEAYVRQGTGDVEGVRRAETQVSGIARDLGNAREMMRFKLLLASRLSTQGDIAGALASYAEATQIARSRDDHELLGHMAAVSSWLRVESGDLDGARRSLDAALVPGLSGDTRALLLEARAAVEALRGDKAAAEASLDAAERAARGPARAHVSVERALIYADEERYAEAEGLARAAEKESSALAPLARLARARALVGLGRHREASDVLEALPASPFFTGVLVQLLVAPVQAVARAGAGAAADVAQARHDLDEVAARADALGFRLSALTARLERARLEVEHGDATRGHEMLAEVAVAADARGFVRLAQRARRYVQ